MYSGQYINNNPLHANPGDTIVLKDPVCPGYKFLGWYDQSENGKKITQLTMSDDIIYQNYYYLYAKWEKSTSGTGGDVPGGNTSGGNTPGGNTPGGNVPGGNTPGGNGTDNGIE